MPKVSVIVPNYNHAAYLNERIDSILTQIFKDFELILMDDCSTDNSRQILETYRSLPNTKIVFNEENSGSSFKQWNKGIALSSGEYIWIAESDDVAELGFLSTLVKILDNNPDVSIAYCQSYEINTRGDITGIWLEQTNVLDANRWAADFIIAGEEMIGKYMAYYNCIPNASGVLFRKAKIVDIGMADETFKLNGDWLFWIQLMENSSVAFVAKNLNYFRKHDSTVRENLQKTGTGMYEYSRILEYLFLHTLLNKVEIRKMVLQFYTRLKWSPPFVSIRREPGAFRLVYKCYSKLLKSDGIALYLCAKHVFFRFCYLYLSMIWNSVIKRSKPNRYNLS